MKPYLTITGSTILRPIKTNNILITLSFTRQFNISPSSGVTKVFSRPFEVRNR